MMVKLGRMMVKQITPRILVCKRYDAASYHLYARTQVRAYKHIGFEYDGVSHNVGVISKTCMFVHPNPGSAVRRICHCVICLAHGSLEAVWFEVLKSDSALKRL